MSREHINVYWDCPDVVRFWKQISLILSEMLKTKIPLLQKVFLLNDDFTCLLWAGLTVAKKNDLPWQQCDNSFLEIVLMEWSVAQMHGASLKTLEM